MNKLNRWLVDYNPSTTTGTTTVSVTLTAAAGPKGPGVSFSMSWSYPVADVQAYDNSDFSLHRAPWEHTINPMKPAGMNTYLAKPGFVVKTRQNYFSFVNANYKVWFVSPVIRRISSTSSVLFWNYFVSLMVDLAISA